jgi:DNA-binding CsgD family transcriptional regulator
MGMPERLSPRQLECATLFAHGLQAQEIGRRLNIQTRTVEAHIEEAYRRLNISGRPALRRALGIEYGGEPLPIPKSAAVTSHASVDEADAETAEAASPSLYELYAKLGRWRTPPRGPFGRLGPILVIAMVVAMIFGGIVGATILVVGAVDSIDALHRPR